LYLAFLLLILKSLVKYFARGPAALGIHFVVCSLSVFVFQSIVPAGLESRFLIPRGAVLDSVYVRRYGMARLVTIGPPLAFPTSVLRPSGRRGVSVCNPDLQDPAEALLGLLISEITMCERGHDGFVLRASKVLSERIGWDGTTTPGSPLRTISRNT